VTSASIVYHLVRQTKRQVLVCAPSNVVVDMLAQRIHETGVKVLRFCSKSRESVSSDVEELTLHYKLRNLKENGFDKLKEYYKQLDDEKNLSAEDEAKFKQLRKKAEEEIIKSSEVICATCIASADRRLAEFYFSHVLIDEATQAIEPECLLPMIKGAKQVILVGDHLQLGPVVICRETAKAGLNKCLF
jgi:regulator of nonsense transcripts 1